LAVDYKENAENQQINLLQSSRFGEALRITQDRLDAKNFYAFNPAFDRCESCD
jgi:spore coat protein JC